MKVTQSSAETQSWFPELDATYAELMSPPRAALMADANIDWTMRRVVREVDVNILGLEV